MTAIELGAEGLKRRLARAERRGKLRAFLLVAPLLAFAVLALYALACFVLPVVVTRRRDLV